MKLLVVQTHLLSNPMQSNLLKNQPSQQVNLLTKFGVLGFTAMVALTGCNKVKQFGINENASTTASTASAANPSTDHTQAQATPVVYPINEWQQQSLTNKVSLQDSEAIKALLGQPLLIDDQGLDYRSNVATKYSFAKVAEPYFDLMDSPVYLELQWYFADAHDNATIKNISVNYAKKAFILTQNWFGQDGSDIVANMVQGQSIKNKTYHGILVELARCENYHCDLVIKKPTITRKDKKKRS